VDEPDGPFPITANTKC